MAAFNQITNNQSAVREREGERRDGSSLVADTRFRCRWPSSPLYSRACLMEPSWHGEMIGTCSAVRQKLGFVESGAVKEKKRKPSSGFDYVPNDNVLFLPFASSPFLPTLSFSYANGGGLLIFLGSGRCRVVIKQSLKADFKLFHFKLLPIVSLCIHTDVCVPAFRLHVMT